MVRYNLLINYTFLLCTIIGIDIDDVDLVLLNTSATIQMWASGTAGSINYTCYLQVYACDNLGNCGWRISGAFKIKR